MKVQMQIEKIIILIIAIVSVLVSVLDFVGALDSLLWLSQRIHIMTLLSIGALYLLSQDHRGLNTVEQRIIESSEAILRKIDSDKTNNGLLENIERLWAERENNFQQVFKQASKVAASEGVDALIAFLKGCEEAFDKGEIFETKSNYAWDFNFTLINSKGDYVYHIIEDMISTRRWQDHPNWEILKRRNGTLRWVNRVRGKLNQVNNFPFRSNLRFTKLYFQEVTGLDLILIIQSHINILPILPKRTPIDS